ncbi:MAG: hypothetical protein EA402_08125 [Planctomycetota bacterium]|nr:MAG: hypothetical protein EA402_08125 [Planctomycetota bacterium]
MEGAAMPESSDSTAPPLLARLPGLRHGPVLAPLLSALARAEEQGHTGLSLRRWDPHRGPACLASLREQLANDEDPGDRPLVLVDGDWLSSRRAWQHECRLASALAQRASHTLDQRWNATSAKLMQDFLPPHSADQAQARAVATAIGHGLSLITGGPGRGKTWVAGLIVALITALESARHLRICLAAPTGKASARLRQSIGEALQRFVAAGLIDQAGMERALAWTSTLHALRLHRDASQLNLLIIDECSMANAALLGSCLDRIPRDCQVVLLGDDQQLASVEPGRVLGDLAALGSAAPQPALAAWWRQYWSSDALPLGGPAAAGNDAGDEGGDDAGAPHPLSRARVHLQTNYRSGKSPVARFGDAIAAHGDGTWQDLLSTCDDHLSQEAWIARRDCGSPLQLIDHLLSRRRPLLQRLTQAEDPGPALESFLAHWLVVSCLRQGPLGSRSLAQLLEDRAAHRGLIPWRDEQGHYPGRPILITRNQGDVHLRNGDLGILWPDEHSRWQLVLRDEQGGQRREALHRIAAWESGLVMTVHKAQGSQASEVDLIGPGDDQPQHPLWTRELLYTAATRAQARLMLHASLPSLQQAITTHIQRHSGLARALRRPWVKSVF